MFRRALLYVPGSNERMIQKAFTAKNVDCIAFDLEDSVPHKMKPIARQNVAAALKTQLSAEKCVRINGANEVGLADLEVILESPVQSILIPKVDSVDDVLRVSDAIDRKNLNDVKIIASIESAKGLLDVERIAQSSAKIEALLFAAEDFAADLGLIRTPKRKEMMYARQKIVAVAKAFGLQAIDLVCVDFRDTNVLREECREGREFGFTGKQAIHPLQCDIIQEVFSPSSEQVEYAQRILRTHAEYEQKGIGAFEIDGKMIDAPVLKWAQKILNFAHLKA